MIFVVSYGMSILTAWAFGLITDLGEEICTTYFIDIQATKFIPWLCYVACFCIASALKFLVFVYRGFYKSLTTWPSSKPCCMRSQLQMFIRCRCTEKKNIILSVSRWPVAYNAYQCKGTCMHCLLVAISDWIIRWRYNKLFPSTQSCKLLLVTVYFGKGCKCAEIDHSQEACSNNYF